MNYTHLEIYHWYTKELLLRVELNDEVKKALAEGWSCSAGPQHGKRRYPNCNRDPSYCGIWKATGLYPKLIQTIEVPNHEIDYTCKWV